MSQLPLFLLRRDCEAERERLRRLRLLRSLSGLLLLSLLLSRRERSRSLGSLERLLRSRDLPGENNDCKRE